MALSPVEISICSTESESWDTIWKWTWFRRDAWWPSYRLEQEPGVQDLCSLLRKHGVKSLLDAACGLGAKTIVLTERGFEVEGADASPVAAEYARVLAAEEGRTIRFLHASNEELGRTCGHTYDCVFSDGFDELPTREMLSASARGIYEVLEEGGLFVFSGIPPEWSPSDLQAVIEREWKEREPFEASEPFTRDGVRLIELEVDEKTAEGILEKRVFLIEERRGALRVEVALLMNRRTWMFRDFDEAMKGSGFRIVTTEKSGTTLFTVAIK